MQQQIQWVVQKNLGSSSSVQDLQSACTQLGLDCILVDIIPFNHALPAFPTQKQSIFYGSTTMNRLVYEQAHLKSGLFFNEAFSIENYLVQWGDKMLNYGAKVTSFRELMNMSYDPEELLFIRPNEDDKSFAGDTKSFGEIAVWYHQLAALAPENLNPDTKIIVGKPYNIQSEWRLWMVKGKVASASKYRQFFRLEKEYGCPQEVVDFAEARCAEYQPHDCFVMDIGRCGDAYYIIECNCLNGAGFYDANVQDIVAAVTDYFYTQIQ